MCTARGAPIGGEVAPDRAERLGEGSHHDVYVVGGHAGMLADAAAGGAHGADAVRLIQVQVRLRCMKQRLEARYIIVRNNEQARAQSRYRYACQPQGFLSGGMRNDVPSRVLGQRRGSKNSIAHSNGCDESEAEF